MKAYGRNLGWIEDHQYGDEMHTGIACPHPGKGAGRGGGAASGRSRSRSGSTQNI